MLGNFETLTDIAVSGSLHLLCRSVPIGNKIIRNGIWNEHDMAVLLGSK